jgi:hypothetical protein
MFLLAWQGGGGIGTGRLGLIGASPWRVALLFAAELTVVATVALACSAAWAWAWASRSHADRRRSNDHDQEDGTVLGWLARNDFDAKPKVAYVAKTAGKTVAQTTAKPVAKTTREDEPNEKGKLAG